MHREFLKLLEKATGRSEHVIAINLDIRGFTPFSQSVESMDVATYVRKVYLKIINDYFKDASYYKPTGDGLIIIIPYSEENLKEVANSTMDSCLALLENFGSLLIGDHMINFQTPKEIGIGLTRGSACCITSDNKVLDYSGRILNLASRLMDLARPSGIVFDESFRIDLLSKKTKELFSEETVYVRGVSEKTPIKIHYTKEHTLISDLHKQPLKEPKWETQDREFLFKEWNRLRERNYFVLLKRKPVDENKIMVRLGVPHPRLKKVDKILMSTHTFMLDDEEISYKSVGSKHYVGIDIQAIKKLLEKVGVTGSTKIKFSIYYPTT